MANESDYNVAYNKVCGQWNKAEKTIKLAEQVNATVVLTSISELRYAGRKLIEAHAKKHEGDFSKAVELLSDAYYDCCRLRKWP